MVIIAPGVVETPLLATVSEEYRVRLAELVLFPAWLGNADERAWLVCIAVEHVYFV
ncbi:hypothetical protein [Pseudofrankia sp. BMG5.37]|uniref:hypothetical protein n=1 Tax=Pseudofrankia sp. BMG5.37 TaxID=3050035 RepID=UPI0012FFCD94|nr:MULTISPECIES: hypothetical protein [unclassified Pseudofrankia]MDT3445781.1 hypothetical protein [Pseudofrankia sp. BMG5.37]